MASGFERSVRLVRRPGIPSRRADLAFVTSPSLRTDRPRCIFGRNRGADQKQRVGGRPPARRAAHRPQPAVCSVRPLPVLALLLPAAAAHLTRSSHRLPSSLRGPPTAFLLAAALAQLPIRSSLLPATVISHAPLAVALLLLAPPPKSSGPSPAGIRRAFLIGAVGSTLGAGVAAAAAIAFGWLSPVVAAQLAAVFCATYVGGSMNYVAVAAAVRLPARLIAAGLAADLLLTAMYLAFLFYRGARASVPTGDHVVVQADFEADLSCGDGDKQRAGSPLRFCLEILAPVIAAAALCAASGAVAAAVPALAGFEVAAVALGAVGVTRLRQANALLVRAPWLADAALLLFFAALGAVVRIGEVVSAGPVVLGFGAVVLIVHLLVVAVVARWACGIGARECLVASNANVGGPTTSAAYAAAMGWTNLVAPAVVIGAAGYAVANPLALILRFTLLSLLGAPS